MDPRSELSGIEICFCGREFKEEDGLRVCSRCGFRIILER
jgi:DNA-directed RNA polymerase subunit RPC12/RpoP